MRFQLYPENQRKVDAALDRIREVHGVTISANRFINMLVAAADSVELHQEFTLTITTTPEPAKPQKPKRVRIKRTSDWLAPFRMPR